MLVIAGALFGWSRLSDPMILGAETELTAAQLLEGTNTKREQNNIAPLQYNDKLSRAAYMKAQDMFKQQYWAHIAPDGSTPWAWFAKTGYNYSYAGENLAKNFATAQGTVNGWMASQKHRENLLSVRYKDVGFAVVDGTLQGRQTTLIVALYGEPLTENAVAGAAVATNAPTGGLNPLAQFGVTLQSMSPVMLGSIVLLLSVSVIALVAHGSRRRLPLRMRQKSWRDHQNIFKAVGLSSVAVAFIVLYSGGQI